MTRFKELAVISSRVAADDYKDEKLLPSCLVRDSCLHGPEGPGRKQKSGLLFSRSFCALALRSLYRSAASNREPRFQVTRPLPNAAKHLLP